MAHHLAPKVLTSNTGAVTLMPAVGFGTYTIAGDQCVEAVECALNTGYRAIDTARVYGNEAQVAEGIRRSGVPRSEIFITTKLSPRDQGEEGALKAVDASLAALETDYIDLYLIHWPGASNVEGSDPAAKDLRHGSWKALQEMQKEGKVRAIGVSNFMIPHLKELLAWDGLEVKPAVDQVECHPFLPQTELRDFCKSEGIILEAYSSLGRGKELMTDETVAKVAQAHEKSPAQVLLRWGLEHGCPVIPKSVTPERIRSNFELDFDLSDEDMKALDGLETGQRYCWDPNTIEH